MGEKSNRARGDTIELSVCEKEPDGLPSRTHLVEFRKQSNEKQTITEMRFCCCTQHDQSTI